MIAMAPDIERRPPRERNPQISFISQLGFAEHSITRIFLTQAPSRRQAEASNHAGLSSGVKAERQIAAELKGRRDKIGPVGGFTHCQAGLSLLALREWDRIGG